VSFLCPNKKCNNYDEAFANLESHLKYGSFLPGLEKDIYATIVATPVTPKANAVSATNYITITSMTDVVATNMTLTPAAGTYMVTFSSLVSGSVFLSLWSGGQRVRGTERIIASKSIDPRSSYHITDDISNVMTQGIITVDGSQKIEARWRVSENTGIMYGRTLSIIQLVYKEK